MDSAKNSAISNGQAILVLARERQDFLTAVFCIGCTIAIVVQPLNEFLRKIYQASVAIKNVAGKVTAKTTPQQGDRIAGHIVTSPYLPCEKRDKSDCRKHPITGVTKAHLGTDIATSVGTQLFAPGVLGSRVTIACGEDAIAGVTAWIAPSNPHDYQFRAIHLSRCESGEYLAGQVFALTGNTGRSTGPHLHFEQYKNGEVMPPQEKYIHKMLAGGVY